MLQHIKDKLQPHNKEPYGDNAILPIQFPLMALEILAELPSTGNEEKKLTGEFSKSLDYLAQNEHQQELLLETLQELNPNFIPKTYSHEAKANILANVVAAIYAPIIHAFSNTVLKNIKKGNLSHVVVAPPRDALPFANSIKILAKLQKIPILIIKPAITRVVAGIANAQDSSTKEAKPHLLLPEYIQQEFGPHLDFDFTEIEPGIYSTTSMIIADLIGKISDSKYTALKLYGLGPNLSFTHALLSGGKEWIAEEAEKTGKVDTQLIANLMAFLDSTEELGMEKMHGRVIGLKKSSTGEIEPDCESITPEELHIAQTTNQAIIDTAPQHMGKKSLKVAKHLLANFDKITSLAQQGFPVSLTAPIPSGSANAKDAHFENIRTSGLISSTKKLTL